MDAAGNLLHSTTFTKNGTFEATVPSQGDYYFIVSDDDRYNSSWAIGDYALTSSFASDPATAYDGAVNDSNTTAVATLTNGTTLTPANAKIVGTLSHNADTDYFKLQARTGGLVTLNFTHPDGISGGGGIQVKLVDAAGNLLHSTTFTKNGTFEATVPSQGDYYFIVSDDDRYNSSWAKGHYLISSSSNLVNQAPTGTVIVTGTATQGQTLTVTNTLADPDGLGVITYQWKANGTAIGGATSSSYTLTPAEVGKTITVTASYTDGQGVAESVSSAATAVITTSTPPSEPVVPSKDNQVIVLQPNSVGTVGAGVGDDTYLLSASMLPAGKSITLSDVAGANSLQLAPGLSIASSQIASNALELTLANGSIVRVLGANAFTYDVGGNVTAGIDQVDVSFASFVKDTLGSSVPSVGKASGGSVQIGGGISGPVLASTVLGNDFVVPQYASPATVGAGAGNDTYLISSALLPAGSNVTISDVVGSNSIQLSSGLSIVSSQVTSTALKLTLDTGATVTILGANNFTYDVGGNTTAGVDQADVSYANLVQNTLGVSMPVSGVALGGAVVVGGASRLPVQGNNTVQATAANDLFYFDAVAAIQDTAGTNTQATITGFSTSADKLQINLTTADPAITTLDQLNGLQGVTVQFDPFDNSTVINFGNDANGAEVVRLTLLGVTGPELVAVQII